MVDSMLVAALVPVIAKILVEAAGNALRLRDIEFKVKDLEFKIKVKNKEEIVRPDTFDVRDAVSELVAAGKAEFDRPGYKVRLKETGEESVESATPTHKASPSTSHKPKP